MTYDEFASVINSDISRILKENSENILESLIDGLPDEPCITKEQMKMCRNAVNLSVHLSCQIAFSYLSSLGICNPENLTEHFEKPTLTVIQGGLSGKKK